MMTDQNSTISMKKYVLQYIGYLILAIIIISVIEVIIDYEFSSISIILTFAISASMGTKFANDQERIPTPTEKHIFARGIFVFQILVAAFALGIIYYIASVTGEPTGLEPLSQLGLSLLIVLFLVLFMVFIYYIPYWAFGMGAKNVLKRLKKTGESNE